MCDPLTLLKIAGTVISGTQAVKAAKKSVPVVAPKDAVAAEAIEDTGAQVALGGDGETVGRRKKVKSTAASSTTGKVGLNTSATGSGIQIL